MSRPARRTTAPRCRKCGGVVERYEEEIHSFHVRAARPDGWPEAECGNIDGRIVGVFACCGVCRNRWKLHDVPNMSAIEAPAGSLGEKGVAP